MKFVCVWVVYHANKLDFVLFVTFLVAHFLQILIFRWRKTTLLLTIRNTSVIWQTNLLLPSIDRSEDYYSLKLLRQLQRLFFK